MRYIMSGVSIFLVIFCVNGVMMLLRKPSDTDGQTVILPKGLLVVGIVCSCFF